MRCWMPSSTGRTLCVQRQPPRTQHSQHPPGRPLLRFGRGRRTPAAGFVRRETRAARRVFVPSARESTVTTREGAKEAPLLLLRAQARTLYVRSCARRRSRARAGEGALPLGPPSNFLFPPTRFPEAVALGWTLAVRRRLRIETTTAVFETSMPLTTREQEALPEWRLGGYRDSLLLLWGFPNPMRCIRRRWRCWRDHAI